MIRIWSRMLLAQWRAQPARMLATLLAIAIGVALSSAVYFVNAGALSEFGQATRRLVGEADLIVRGPSRTGFAEGLYTQLARAPGVETASPVLELDVAIPARRTPLRVLGMDPFRAAQLQPALFGELGGQFVELFAADGIVLSTAAADSLGVQVGERFDVLVGGETRSLHVLGVLTPDSYPQPIGIMDIASAQWTLDQLGRLNRIDLRLAPGTDPVAMRRSIATLLPAGVQAVEPQIERDRAVSVTRAYRVNLNMLALVSLLTGAFLVFSTQSLSVLRRRTALALLRALGVTRGELQWALFSEGLLLGAVGSLLGVVFGHLLAAFVLEQLRGDFGGGQLAVNAAGLAVQPVAALAFFAIGTMIASAGAWAPAREAAHRAPARALKSGDAEPALERLRHAGPGLLLLAAGTLLAFLPPLGGIPVFGYLAVAALLFGGVLLVPRITTHVLAWAPRTGRAALDLGLSRLRGGVGQFTVSLAAIIVSFSLMIAMAIMVYSFRDSFVRWLGAILPADVQIRAGQGSDTAWLTPADMRAVAAVAGVERTEFRRLTPLLLDPSRPAVTLIARDALPGSGREVLPLLRTAAGPAPPGVPPAWISEAMQDLYGAQPGARITLPLAGQRHEFFVAGVFRDYGRSSGAVVIGRDVYRQLARDERVNEGSVWLAPDHGAAVVIAAIRAALPRGDALDLLETTQVRDISLRIFDRAFLVTYALEAVAVIIGLLGVAFAASSTALARRAEFGMLRHLGLLRRQVLAMLAGEGLLTSLIGVLYGLALGMVLSLVLVYVINRQSFSWSVDLAVPWQQLVALSFALVIAAAVTATLAGRAVMGADSVRAVREDW